MIRFLFWAIVLSVLWSHYARAETPMLAVPFKAQVPPANWTNNLNCGPAAALMLAAYYKDFTPRPTDLQAELDWMYTNHYIQPQAEAEYYDGNFTTAVHLEKILTDYFHLGAVIIRRENDLNALKVELSKGNPIIVAVNLQMDQHRLGHFMVVVGLSDTAVIVHDPGRTGGAFNHYSLSRFLLSWRTSNYASLVLENSGPTWHPNGTLLQQLGTENIFLVRDGALHKFQDEDAFYSYHFDERQIITASPEELNCFARREPILTAPSLQLLSVEESIYLLAKASAASDDCSVYWFASQLSYESWGIPGSIIWVYLPEAIDQYFTRCRVGGVLYARPGTLLKPQFALPDFGPGVVFVAEGNGALRPFADERVFQSLKYSYLPIWPVNERQFYATFTHYGPMIDERQARRCLIREPGNPESLSPSGSGGDTVGGLDPSLRHSDESSADADQDGFSVAQGDCDDNRANAYPGAREICDGHDNNCDGRVDEGVLCPTDEVCWEGKCISARTPAYNPGTEEVLIHCQVTCSADKRAYIWYGSYGEVSGQPRAEVRTTLAEVCLRGQPWIDFNCACTEPVEWACFDWQAAQVTCNQVFRQSQGEIDARGEGEIWFTERSCF